MTISWLGEAGLRLQLKDTVVLIDPPTSRPVRGAAQMVAITQKDGREWKNVAGEPLLVETPGEFERAGVFIYGIHLPSEPTRVHFRIEAEDLSIGHLGDLDHKIENGELSALEGVDVLCVPVGGKGVLTAEQAAELVSQIEPRIIIPIQYQAAGLKTPYTTIDAFVKTMAVKNVEPVEKFKIEKKNLPAEDAQVVILLPS